MHHQHLPHVRVQTDFFPLFFPGFVQIALPWPTIFLNATSSGSHPQSRPGPCPGDPDDEEQSSFSFRLGMQPCPILNLTNFSFLSFP